MVVDFLDILGLGLDHFVPLGLSFLCLFCSLPLYTSHIFRCTIFLVMCFIFLFVCPSKEKKERKKEGVENDSFVSVLVHVKRA